MVDVEIVASPTDIALPYGEAKQSRRASVRLHVMTLRLPPRATGNDPPVRPTNTPSEYKRVELRRVTVL